MTKKTRAERIILVSMIKSGTHLITELLTALGYRMHGHVRVRPETKPVLDRGTRWRMAGMVYDDERLTDLKKQDEAIFTAATDQAWEALAWAWKLRWGMPLVNQYSSELINTSLVRQALERTAGTPFTETPANVCWVLHEFDVRNIDGAFLSSWAGTGEPRVIFNYRDPRDVILSMINFASGRTKGGLSAINNLQAFSSILCSMPTLDERLTYALTDESFPAQARDYMRMLWLLHHPNVYATSFEDLVGPEGGGSAEAQLRATAGLIEFLGADAAPEDVARNLFNRDAFTFFKGQVGGWKEVYTDEHRRIADKRFAEVLPLYGYV
ncbi:hypothetical protein GCM10010191_47370 [Actinomadura vinacea]|uniref:Sulfotransferase domain-containing protein n=2 Tax=Actinomadura vinacea TaxID=115336 RepID=A0ABP5WJU6_9ACTN